MLLKSSYSIHCTKIPSLASVAPGQKALGKGHFSPCSLPAATAKTCSFAYKKKGALEDFHCHADTTSPAT